MVEWSHDEFSQFPVESIARFLSVCANEDPTLVRRAGVPPAAAALNRINMRLPPPLRPAGPPPPHASDSSDQSAYLEELVSIAVKSARLAEDAARQVGVANATARRRMFAISAFGAIGILTGIAGMSGVGFGLDISALLPIAGSKFAAADKHHPVEPGLVVAVHPPPVTATQPLPSKPSAELAGDLAALPRTAEPPLASITAPAPATSQKDLQTARAAQHDDPWALRVELAPPAASAPAKLAGPQIVEAMLHDNAAREAAELRATASPTQDSAPTSILASVPPDEANNRARAQFVRPLPVPPNSSRIERSQVAFVPAEPGRGAPSAFAAVRVSAAPSKPWQLVAAVQALEALTNSEGEPGAPP